MPGILTLSSSALTDRMLVYSGFFPALRGHTEAHVWASSYENVRFAGMWSNIPAKVETFPQVVPWPEFPHNRLRRLNDFAWDFYLKDPSRLSMMRHIRDHSQKLSVRLLKYPGWLLAKCGLHQALETRLERLLTGYERSLEATRRLQEVQPDLVLSTGTFRYEEPAVVACAKRLNIPVAGLVTSWDNISIKNRMVFAYDAYVVWSERMKQELLHAYPQSRTVPVYVVGAPQFDVFFQQHRYVPRAEFCASLGLDASRPIVLHAMGVANGVEEHHAALELARRQCAGEFGRAQLIIRPHPFQNHLELRNKFREFAPDVVVQQFGDPSEQRRVRSQGEAETNIWVNTFRHSDVVVHLSSSVAIDAALFDRPSVCIDFDPMPGQPRQAIVRDVNHSWTHYKPVIETGGTRLAADYSELVAAVKRYLDNPALERTERRAMAEYVCGYTDGRCGERLGAALLELREMLAPGKIRMREVFA